MNEIVKWLLPSGSTNSRACLTNAADILVYIIYVKKYILDFTQFLTSTQDPWMVKLQLNHLQTIVSVNMSTISSFRDVNVKSISFFTQNKYIFGFVRSFNQLDLTFYLFSLMFASSFCMLYRAFNGASEPASVERREDPGHVAPVHNSQHRYEVWRTYYPVSAISRYGLLDSKLKLS